MPLGVLRRTNLGVSLARLFSACRRGSSSTSPGGRGEFVECRVLRVKSGSGGRGCVYFRKHASHSLSGPGEPRGGAGGSGGRVLLRLDPSKASVEADLRHLPGWLAAGRGGDGLKEGQRGRDGEDAVALLPSGCVVWELLPKPTGNSDTPEISEEHRQKNTLEEAAEALALGREFGVESAEDGAERRRRRFGVSVHWKRNFLCEIGVPLSDSLTGIPSTVAAARDAMCGRELSVQLSREVVGPVREVVVSCGGRGGLGNSRSSPHCAEEGESGEERLLLIVKMWEADVALVGATNAGKTHVLSSLTRSACSPSPWPHATQHPQMGRVMLEEHGHPEAPSSLSLMDLPGVSINNDLSESSAISEERTLRLIEAAKILAFVVDAASASSRSSEASSLASAVLALKRKLLRRSPILAAKPVIVICSKCDLWPHLTLAKVDDLWRELILHDAALKAETQTKMDEFLSSLEDRLTSASHKTLLRKCRAQLQFGSPKLQVVPVSARENMGLQTLVRAFNETLTKTEQLNRALMQIQRLAWRAEG